MKTCTFSFNSSGQLNILGHYGHTFGVDDTQVVVFKWTNQVVFAGFLKGTDYSALEPKVSLETLGDFSNQPLEGQLAN